MREVNKVTVVGAGIMGNGIAQVLAQSGFHVAMVDVDENTLSRGIDTIKKSLGKLKKRGKLSDEEAAETLERIKPTLSLDEAAHDADFVIEAVTEELSTKQKIFRDLDAICPFHTVLATNTSTISITAIASATKRTDRVLGMHFANPVPLMKGVVINTGLDTSEETINAAKWVASMMGKEYMINKDSPGFAGNRLLPLFINEAFNVVWEKIATPEDIDKDARLSFRHPMGPLELADLIGLDQLLNGLEYMYREWGEKYRPSPLLKQLVGAGYHGRKTRRGIYEYDDYGMKVAPKSAGKISFPGVPFAKDLFTEENGGALLANKCQSCGAVFFPKRQTCTDCYNGELQQILLREGAKLYTFTTVNMPAHKYKPPFTVGWVEFPEGVRVMSQIKNADNRRLEIGMALELIIDTLWEEDGRQFVGYKFKPIG